MRLWIARVVWWFQKRFDKSRILNEAQSNELVRYYETAMRMFQNLDIDIKSKSKEEQRLYTMMLLYLDYEEVICPSGARTASMIKFLESLNSNWILPPSSQVISDSFAKDIDGYVALEIMQNNRGIGDISNEIRAAINSKGNLI